MKRPLPILTCEQVRQVDRLAIDELGMSGLVLMENAGRGIVELLMREQATGRALICCGRGNNAGDGFVIARHLDLRGWQVEVLCWVDPERLEGDARANYSLLQSTDVVVQIATGSEAMEFPAQDESVDWVIDALLGTGARGAPRPPLDRAIHAMNRLRARRLAVDLPSGLDADAGQPTDPTFRADWTCTFVAAKPGLLTAQAAPFVGQLHVIDIGVPRRLLQRFGLQMS